MLQEVSQAEFDAFMASVKKALFKDNVSKAEYTRMKQVGHSASLPLGESLSCHQICCKIGLGACSFGMIHAVFAGAG